MVLPLQGKASCEHTVPCHAKKGTGVQSPCSEVDMAFQWVKTREDLRTSTCPNIAVPSTLQETGLEVSPGVLFPPEACFFLRNNFEFP
jgi:hypothetical protein